MSSGMSLGTVRQIVWVEGAGGVGEVMLRRREGGMGGRVLG